MPKACLGGESYVGVPMAGLSLVCTNQERPGEETASYPCEEPQNNTETPVHKQQLEDKEMSSSSLLSDHSDVQQKRMVTLTTSSQLMFVKAALVKKLMWA